MQAIERVKNWVESGKQVGETLEFLREGRPCLGSVGVQKWGKQYKVYVDEIFESNLIAEEYEREELVAFEALEDVIRFVDGKTRTTFGRLHPCRGQRIFNPAHKV